MAEQNDVEELTIVVTEIDKVENIETDQLVTYDKETNIFYAQNAVPVENSETETGKKKSKLR